MTEAESNDTTYTTAAHSYAKATLEHLDELSCALWLAVEAVRPALAEDHACEAAALRGIARVLGSEIGDARDELGRFVTIDFHTPVRRVPERTSTAEAA